MTHAPKLTFTPHSLVWTGDIESKSSKFLISGFKGSLRWWYETLIRAFNKYACDPTDKGCLFELTDGEQRELDNLRTLQEKSQSLRALAKQKICPACYLFGCTGWQARFLFGRDAIDKNPTSQDFKGGKYVIPIRERFGLGLEDAELYLLDLLCAFISEHGSICAKNGLKPSEETANNNEKNRDSYRNHVNYGLCTLVLEHRSLSINGQAAALTGDFLQPFPGKKNKEEWPNFRYIWYADVLLTRDNINQMVGRNQREKDQPYPPDTMDEFMGGTQGISKKIFAFHTVDTVGLDRPRVWGYCQANEEGRNWLGEKWPADQPYCWGEQYLQDKGVI